MSGPLRNLLVDHPVLVKVRAIDSWWALHRVISENAGRRGEMSKAVLAWASADRNWGDQPGASAHDELHRAIDASISKGADKAFQERVKARAPSLPSALRDLMHPFEAAIGACIAEPGGEVFANAEIEWVRVIRAYDMNALPLDIRTSLNCDAAVLQKGVYDWFQTDDTLQRWLGVLGLAFASLRDLRGHPPACLVSLDPRPQALAASVGAAKRLRFQRTGDNTELEGSLDLLRAAAGMIPDWSPERPAILSEMALTLQNYREIQSSMEAQELLRTAYANEPASRERTALACQLARCLLDLVWMGGGLVWAPIAVSALKEEKSPVDPYGATYNYLLAEALLLQAAGDGNRRDLEQAIRKLGEVMPGLKTDTSKNSLRALEARLEALHGGASLARALRAALERLSG